MPNTTDQTLRDDDWQKDYLGRLGDVVINLLDNTDDVPSYLASSSNVPLEYKPEDLCD